MSRTGVWVMAVLAAACSRSAPDNLPAAPAMDLAESVAPMADAAMKAGSGGAPRAISLVGAPATPSQTTPTQTARMIVRSAELSLQVSDVRKAAQLVADATTSVDGFLGASRLWRDGEMDRASMTVRVPSAKLDATIARLRQVAVRVDNEAVTGEDVTRQSVDLTAQLTNLRATEAELRELLKTVRIRTQRASDVLEVHTELARVRGEIDQHAAELQSLSQLAALSTITLELRPDVVASPIATDAWQPRGVLRDALRALAGTGRVAVNAVIWTVVYVAPLLLLAGGLLFGLRRVWTRNRRGLATVAG
ncbi:MAG: DUF4349 domain-containing protein [Gemmatimonadaceae bacterium]|nr:DUF4349 domain-containing protein [Gemmatimonadaceae bacterium]